jgi:predicted transcriptional regulator
MTESDQIIGHAVNLTIALIAKQDGIPPLDSVKRMLNLMYDAVLHTLDAPDEKIAGGRQLTEEEIKATITEDGQYLVSLEDGKKYKSLKRSLARAGLTPDQYRAKWGLPAVYPMVSVGYSITRRDLALAAGLGRGKKGTGKK